MNSTFWRDKSVFITGHTGFKGSWLALWLQSLGARVSGYSLAPATCPNMFEVANVGRGMESVIGDIRDTHSLARAMERSKPEIVFHLAAQALVRCGYQSPIETFGVNVLGTACLLEAVKRIPNVKAIIVVTSDKCYQNSEDGIPYKENDVLGGHDPYSSSKACAELVVAAYRSSFFSSTCDPMLASVRAGNVIGGGDWATDRLVPDIVRAICTGKPVAIRDPNAIRPWQHVLEPLGGYLFLAEKLFRNGPEFAGPWNFGPADEDAQRVQILVEHAVALWGDGARWILDEGQHPKESKVLKLDCQKARQRLGWEPRWRLAQALEATVAWYKAHARGDNVREISLEQIESYQNSAMAVAG